VVIEGVGFVAGLLFALTGALHCVGMCGAFPALVAAGGRAGPTQPARPIVRHIIYNVGRVLTYALIGLIALSAVHALSLRSARTEWFSAADIAMRVTSVAVGLFFVWRALVLFGWTWSVGRQGLGATGASGRAVVRLGATAARMPGVRGALLLGVVNGLLPCPLVYGMVALAVAAGSWGAGLATIGGFALGTTATMLALALPVAALVRAGLGRFRATAAVLLLALGLLTVLRGLPGPDRVLHWGPHPVAAAAESPPCCHDGGGP